MTFNLAGNEQHFARALALCWFLGAVALTGACILLSGGHLVYTLDDPYIHLAVAENILHGGYGVNSGEFSSPSSSVAYPLILAVTEFLGLGTWGPLVVNMLAMGTAVYGAGIFLKRYVFTGSDPAWLSTLLVGLAVVLCMNGWGLPLTGMEHSLHVLCVVAVVLGFADLAQDGRVRGWLVAAIILMPLIRFEGLAMALAAIGVLFALGHRRAALIALAAIVIALGSWMAAMKALSLPLLPSSVMVKSGVAANAVDGSGLARIFKSVAENLVTTITDRQASLLLIALGGLIVGSVAAYRRGEARLAVGVGVTCTLALLAHLAFGRYGWFARYEIYIVTATVLALMVLWRRGFEFAYSRLLTLWILGIFVVPYAYATLMSPFASRGIHEQQYQMHRFATDFWKRPVAVNDLGYVSYRNSEFVLDLWGLGSEEVRVLKRDGKLNPDTMTALLARHDVSLVMVYESWFRNSLPPDWQRIAVMKSVAVTAASGEVTFFATSDVDAARKAVREFAATLPARVRLELHE